MIRPKLLSFYSGKSLLSLLHSFKSLTESCVCEHMSVKMDHCEKNKSSYTHLTLKHHFVISWNGLSKDLKEIKEKYFREFSTNM